MKNIEEHVIQRLRAECGIAVVRLTHLGLGADVDAAVYKAESADGKVYFVKLKRGAYYDITQLLVEAGVKQVIGPIATVAVDESTMTVYPFVEGQNGFSRELKPAQWIALGKTLRQVHEIDVPMSVQNKIRREEFSSKWRKRLRALYEVQPCQEGVSLQLWQFMQDHMVDIRRLVDGAEELARIIHNPQYVLCHSDIHAGNVLIGEESIFIVDWDDPIMAPKERDLMFIGAGVANVWNNPHEEELFYKGYGKTEVDRTILAYYRHERIVEDIAIYAEALLLTPDGDEREVMYSHFVDMFAPRGVVEIAFETKGSL